MKPDTNQIYVCLYLLMYVCIDAQVKCIKFLTPDRSIYFCKRMGFVITIARCMLSDIFMCNIVQGVAFARQRVDNI